MTNPITPAPATDEEIAAYLELHRKADGDEENEYWNCDLDANVTVRQIIARIAQDAETIKAREAAFDSAQEGLKSARKQEGEMRETIKAQAQELDIANATIQKLRESYITDPGECDETVNRIAAVEWARNGRTTNRCQLQNAAMVILDFDVEIKAQAEEIERLKGKLEIAGHEYTHVVMLKDELAQARKDIQEIAKIADFQIPPYAYADNEAAVEMSDRLQEISALALQPRYEVKL